jgi:hypothetical protein
MKKTLLAAPLVLALAFSAGAAYAEPVRDWKDLEAVHKHVQEAIHEMERAQASNHYDMDGHAVKAEEALRHAEQELGEAVESAKRHHEHEHEHDQR